MGGQKRKTGPLWLCAPSRTQWLEGATKPSGWWATQGGFVAGLMRMRGGESVLGP